MQPRSAKYFRSVTEVLGPKDRFMWLQFVLASVLELVRCIVWLLFWLWWWGMVSVE